MIRASDLYVSFKKYLDVASAWHVFHVDDRPHFRFGIELEFSGLDFLVSSTRLVAGILEWTDFRFGVNLKLFGLNFNISAAWFVRGIFQWADFWSCVPLKLHGLDLYKRNRVGV